MTNKPQIEHAQDMPPGGQGQRERNQEGPNPNRGQTTRAAILDTAVSLARTMGLEGLTIGVLADRVGLSKSGCFAHFRSKEGLQLQVLQRAAEEFVEAVLVPALKEPRGEPRIRALARRWLTWATSCVGGCLFVGAAGELDDRPGRVRDFLVRVMRDWLGALSEAVRAAQEEGHFQKHVDPEQFAFDAYAVMLGFHLSHRLLSDPQAELRAKRAFDALLQRARSPSAQPA